jgi:hypothetical protein
MACQLPRGAVRKLMLLDSYPAPPRGHASFDQAELEARFFGDLQRTSGTDQDPRTLVDEHELTRRLRVFRANLDSLDAHPACIYHGDATVVRAAAQRDDIDLASAWSPRIAGALDAIAIDADHYGLLDGAALQLIVETLE